MLQSRGTYVDADAVMYYSTSYYYPPSLSIGAEVQLNLRLRLPGCVWSGVG